MYLIHDWTSLAKFVQNKYQNPINLQSIDVDFDRLNTLKLMESIFNPVIDILEDNKLDSK